MLNNKQKAYLKGVANGLSNQFVIGKDGVTENLIRGIDDFLRVNEIIKINVLKTQSTSLDEIVTILTKRLDAELVQQIGRIIILYRLNKDQPVIDLKGMGR